MIWSKIQILHWYVLSFFFIVEPGGDVPSPLTQTSPSFSSGWTSFTGTTVPVTEVSCTETIYDAPGKVIGSFIKPKEPNWKTVAAQILFTLNKDLPIYLNISDPS